MTNVLFLDFDGVICDSVNECFVSSWIAFHDRYRGDSPRAVGLDIYAKFRSLRPFIRTGQDFLVVQELISEGLSVGSQAEFDAAADRAGQEKLATFDSLLHAVREDLIANNPDYWLPLHRPFGSLAGPLRAAARSPSVWIVSTKRPELIGRILHYWQIDWVAGRIVFPVRRTKIDAIKSIMRRYGHSRGVFVDDQQDHLRCEPGIGLECRLAEWAHRGVGAVLPPGVERIGLDELCELVGSFGS
ncbi:MAG: hypothetical protein V3S41_05735 [Spirochaetia bacterium]